ncbi:uncharacterized protein MONBRDRAFT_28363 [Monosiga brevicollis MX1]|uniref:Pesticidal crystal protein Cry22Aa Ig-like domain-containing protein n=1 Tax=Monosiga brevicollis TaxID=81824 RepID=A9V7Y6_MONBE|nr:uncharacterized protein MONBRDRAFT_28363 [Monosiga brevicollis MX1]EDQ86387.1 predicted protein [Monosiga brevicollis MX1]|eukprot:XP_001748777.1 hypothetical protein [Monosiga brevicollis MX1]
MITVLVIVLASLVMIGLVLLVIKLVWVRRRRRARVARVKQDLHSSPLGLMDNPLYGQPLADPDSETLRPGSGRGSGVGGSDKGDPSYGQALYSALDHSAVAWGYEPAAGAENQYDRLSATGSMHSRRAQQQSGVDGASLVKGQGGGESNEGGSVAGHYDHLNSGTLASPWDGEVAAGAGVSMSDSLTMHESNGQYDQLNKAGFGWAPFGSGGAGAGEPGATGNEYDTLDLGAVGGTATAGTDGTAEVAGMDAMMNMGETADYSEVSDGPRRLAGMDVYANPNECTPVSGTEAEASMVEDEAEASTAEAETSTAEDETSMVEDETSMAEAEDVPAAGTADEARVAMPGAEMESVASGANNALVNFVVPPAPDGGGNDAEEARRDELVNDDLPEGVSASDETGGLATFETPNVATSPAVESKPEPAAGSVPLASGLDQPPSRVGSANETAGVPSLAAAVVASKPVRLPGRVGPMEREGGSPSGTPGSSPHSTLERPASSTGAGAGTGASGDAASAGEWRDEATGVSYELSRDLGPRARRRRSPVPEGSGAQQPAGRGQEDEKSVAREAGDGMGALPGSERGEPGPVSRRLHVVDDTPPVIQLLGPAVWRGEVGTPYVEPGWNVTDDVDRNVSVTVVDHSFNAATPLVVGSVVYVARDSANNTATVTRQIVWEDTRAPTITMQGTNPMFVQMLTDFVDPGATVTDAGDPSLGPALEASSNNVSTDEAGVYAVCYRALDERQNEAVVCRRVVVGDRVAPKFLNLQAVYEVEAGLSLAAFPLDTVEPWDAVDGVLDWETISSNYSDLNPRAVGMHAVTLRVSDASGNVNVTVVRVALRDSRAPNLTLHYVEPWDFERGPGWQDPMNVSAVDAVAGDVRSSVKRRAVVMTTGVPASICEGANQYYAAMTGQEGSSDNGLTGLVSASDMPEPGPVAAVNGWAVAGTEYRLEYSANDGNGNVAHEAAHMRIVDTRAPRLEVDDLVVAEYGVGSMFVDLVHPEPVDEPNQDLRGRLCAVAWRYELTAGLGERVSGNDAGVLVPVYAEARWREYARDPSAWESMAVPLAELTLDAMVGTLYRVSFEVLDVGGLSANGTTWVLVDDRTAPELTVEGGVGRRTYEFGRQVAVPRVTAMDAHDGNLTAHVAVEGAAEVSGERAGNYTVSYVCRDRFNNVAREEVEIEVQRFEAPPRENVFVAPLARMPVDVASQERSLRTHLRQPHVFVVSVVPAGTWPLPYNQMPGARTSLVNETERNAAETETTAGQERRSTTSSYVVGFAVRNSTTWAWLSVAEMEAWLAGLEAVNGTGSSLSAVVVSLAEYESMTSGGGGAASTRRAETTEGSASSRAASESGGSMITVLVIVLASLVMIGLVLLVIKLVWPLADPDSETLRPGSGRGSGVGGSDKGDPSYGQALYSALDHSAVAWGYEPAAGAENQYDRLSATGSMHSRRAQQQSGVDGASLVKGQGGGESNEGGSVAGHYDHLNSGTLASPWDGEVAAGAGVSMSDSLTMHESNGQYDQLNKAGFGWAPFGSGGAGAGEPGATGNEYDTLDLGAVGGTATAGTDGTAEVAGMDAMMNMGETADYSEVSDGPRRLAGMDVYANPNECTPVSGTEAEASMVEDEAEASTAEAEASTAEDETSMVEDETSMAEAEDVPAAGTADEAREAMPGAEMESVASGANNALVNFVVPPAPDGGGNDAEEARRDELVNDDLPEGVSASDETGGLATFETPNVATSPAVEPKPEPAAGSVPLASGLDQPPSRVGSANETAGVPSLAAAVVASKPVRLPGRVGPMEREGGSPSGTPGSSPHSTLERPASSTDAGAGAGAGTGANGDAASAGEWRDEVTGVSYELSRDLGPRARRRRSPVPEGSGAQQPAGRGQEDEKSVAREAGDGMGALPGSERGEPGPVGRQRSGTISVQRLVVCDLNRVAAEQQLLGLHAPVGSYLIRHKPVAGCRESYVVSVVGVQDQRIVHYRLQLRENLPDFVAENRILGGCRDLQSAIDRLKRGVELGFAINLTHAVSPNYEC